MPESATAGKRNSLWLLFAKSGFILQFYQRRKAYITQCTSDISYYI